MVLLNFEDVEIVLKKNVILRNFNFSLETGDFIGIYGENGSGKSVLAETFAGRIEPYVGGVFCGDNVGVAVVSSYEQNRLIEQERYFDDSEFMHGRTDPGRCVADILGLEDVDACGSGLDVIGILGIEGILDRGIKFLSTGEFRKLLFAKALLSGASVIVLDDPFTGLDVETRNRIVCLIDALPQFFSAVVIISGRFGDLKGCKKHFLLKDGRLGVIGRHECSVFLERSRAFVPETGGNGGLFDKRVCGGRECLVRMNNVGLSFYDDRILSNVNWEVFRGDHWQIVGPNGSGKSSLISLVTGDSPKAYGQEIFLFGRRRGSGETVWDIKERIGFVSGNLQRLHRIDQSVLSVVVSGFFDTIGFYDRPDPIQLEEARRRCDFFWYF